MDSSHRNEIRARLLREAQEQFAGRGYQATTHADIALAAGIGRTTFYEYFASKEDLLVQLVEERLPQVSVEIVSTIPEDLPADVKLAELVSRMVAFIANDHLGLLLHTEVPRLSDGAQQRIGAAHAALSRAFVAICRAGVEEGRLRVDDPDLAARLVYESIMAAGRVLLDYREPKQHVHGVAAAVVDYALHGLAVPAGD